MARSTDQAARPTLAGGTSNNSNAWFKLAGYPWLDGSEDFTVCGWIHDDALTWTTSSGLFGNWTATSPGHMMVRRIGGDECELRIHTDISSYFVDSSTSFVGNSWNFVGGRRMGTNLHLMLNDDIYGPVTCAGVMSTPGTDYPHFGYRSASQRANNKRMREWAFFRRALPLGTLQRLRDGMNPLIAGPDHYWPLDGTTRDLVGQLHLTVGTAAGFIADAEARWKWLPMPDYEDWEVVVGGVVPPTKPKNRIYMLA